MGLTAAEAARILNVSRNHVYRLARLGRLPRAAAERQRWGGFALEDVERLSLERRRRGGGHPYWATTTEAAGILGVSLARVKQLARGGRIPAVPHEGAWLFRRDQLEVVANARDARKLAGEWGPGVAARD